MNLFDLLGGNGAFTFGHAGVKAPAMQHPGGGFAQMPQGTGVGAAPVGTSQAIAAYGPSISANLQAALARLRAGQAQQTANDTGQRQSDATQQTIDDQTAALIAQRMGLTPDLLAGLGGGGDSYMQMPRGP